MMEDERWWDDATMAERHVRCRTNERRKGQRGNTSRDAVGKSRDTERRTRQRKTYPAKTKSYYYAGSRLALDLPARQQSRRTDSFPSTVARRHEHVLALPPQTMQAVCACVIAGCRPARSQSRQVHSALCKLPPPFQQMAQPAWGLGSWVGPLGHGSLGGASGVPRSKQITLRWDTGYAPRQFAAWRSCLSAGGHLRTRVGHWTVSRIHARVPKQRTIGSEQVVKPTPHGLSLGGAGTIRPAIKTLDMSLLSDWIDSCRSLGTQFQGTETRRHRRCAQTPKNTWTLFLIS